MGNAKRGGDGAKLHQVGVMLRIVWLEVKLKIDVLDISNKDIIQ